MMLFERDPAKVPQHDAMHPESAQLGCRRAARSLHATGSCAGPSLLRRSLQALSHCSTERSSCDWRFAWSLMRAQAGELSVFLPSLHALGEG